MTAGIESKQALRARLLAARRARTPAEIETARNAVRTHVLREYERAARAERPWRRVAAYDPLRSEPGSRELLDALTARGVDVLVPVLLDDRDLDWTAWPLGTDPLGVDAVASADVVLAPALAVDVTGVRLGRGAGCYDRTLRRVRSGVPVAALLYDDEVVDALPTDPWDVPVSAVVTPSGWRQI